MRQAVLCGFESRQRAEYLMVPRDPKGIKWGDYGVDYVAEATGVFTTGDKVHRTVAIHPSPDQHLATRFCKRNGLRFAKVYVYFFLSCIAFSRATIADELDLDSHLMQVFPDWHLLLLVCTPDAADRNLCQFFTSPAATLSRFFQSAAERLTRRHIARSIMRPQVARFQ